MIEEIRDKILPYNKDWCSIWIKRSEISKYKLANNFDIMLSVFEDNAISEHYHKDVDVLK